MSKVLSVNVGLPREVDAGDRVVSTGILKVPVAGRVRVRWLNLEGDGQADLEVHGGESKAVYAYSADHYAAWQRELGRDLAWGAFGENLDLEDFLEDSTCIGDELGIGSAVFQVTEPRLPCFKLGIRFGDPHIIQQFLASGRTGFYVRVLEEGDLGAGDPVELVRRDPGRVPVAEVTRLYTRDRDDTDAIRRLLAVPALADGWRRHFEKRLARGATPTP